MMADTLHTSLGYPQMLANPRRTTLHEAVELGHRDPSGAVGEDTQEPSPQG